MLQPFYCITKKRHTNQLSFWISLEKEMSLTVRITVDNKEGYFVSWVKHKCYHRVQINSFWFYLNFVLSAFLYTLHCLSLFVFSFLSFLHLFWSFFLSDRCFWERGTAGCCGAVYSPFNSFHFCPRFSLYFFKKFFLFVIISFFC